MQGILQGIRVLDLTTFFQGPVTTAHLADMGAEIIKLESPRGGDTARGLVAVSGGIPVGRWNAYFETNNRNKKSFAVDTMTEKGREIVYHLVTKSDVFVTNFSRPAVRRMMLDYQTLSKYNPRLVYGFGSGYGRYGPDRDKPAYDTQGVARAGMMYTLGEPGYPPVYTGGATGDATAAMLLATGVVLALYHRDRSGVGQEVDVSLLGAAIAFSASTLQPYLSTESEYFLHPHSRKEAPNPLWNLYPTKDKWIYMCMRETDRYWPNLCKGLGLEELESDRRFDTHERRCSNAPLLISILESVLVTKTVKEWLGQWQGLGLVVSPVNDFGDLNIDPQAWENQYLTEVKHPVHGLVHMRGFPVEFSSTPASIRSVALELGQHTEEILVELLDYDWDQISQLREEGVIL